MLTLADGTSPPITGAIPWGRASGLTGLAPEALQERGCSCRVFLAESATVRGVSFSRHRQFSSQPRRCHAHVFGMRLRSVPPGGVAVHRAPEPRPVQGDRDGLFDLFRTFPRRLSAGRRVRFP
jgi:hypothetical protein